MPHYLQSPFDRKDEPADPEPANGFYLLSNAPLDELLPAEDTEGAGQAAERPRRPLQPDFVPRKGIDRLHARIANTPRREQFPPFPAALEKPRRLWWGLGADCCYLMIKSGAYLMACWVTAMGLPLMLLLLLSGGQLNLAFLFLGSLFGAFADATPDRQYAFASQSSWILFALATAVAAWRLPRFLGEVSEGLNTARKAP